jgi:hypothetical protein
MLILEFSSFEIVSCRFCSVGTKSSGTLDCKEPGRNLLDPCVLLLTGHFYFGMSFDPRPYASKASCLIEVLFLDLVCMLFSSFQAIR